MPQAAIPLRRQPQRRCRDHHSRHHNASPPLKSSPPRCSITGHPPSRRDFLAAIREFVFASPTSRRRRTESSSCSPSNQQAPPPFAKGSPLLKPPYPSRVADCNVQRTSSTTLFTVTTTPQHPPSYRRTTKLRFTFITINTIASSSSPKQSQSRFRPGRHQRTSAPPRGFHIASVTYSRRAQLLAAAIHLRTCNSKEKPKQTQADGGKEKGLFPNSEP
ncbi:hypothetical protein LR48_Vigan05g091400 [Vigna angularis]|uniref:Uncharacterized protein n=1 Tax=Phaseolus angularis TaxID=3914 RepID=A0A0L9UK82_PHAAN|nr:hypothetical protein LR48_Vigan05g091400 [Vigna angularis]